MNTKIQSLILSFSYFVGLEFLILKQEILKPTDIFQIIFFLILVILGEIFWLYFLTSFKKINFLTISKIIFIVLFTAEASIFIFLFKNFFWQQVLIILFSILFYFIFWAFAQSTRHSFLAFNVFVVAAFLLAFFNFTIIFNFFLSGKFSESLVHFITFLSVLFFYLFLFFLHFEIKTHLFFELWVLVLIFWEIFLTLSFLPLNQFILSVVLVLFLYIIWIFMLAFFENRINKNVIIECVIFVIISILVVLKFIPWKSFLM